MYSINEVPIKCPNCGQPFKKGEKAILQCHDNEQWNWGFNIVHLECPEINVKDSIKEGKTE